MVLFVGGRTVQSVYRRVLATPWGRRSRAGYDVIIIGSGYGGAITAGRLASAHWRGGKPSICILERGKEWIPGQFPGELGTVTKSLRTPEHPLGLIDLNLSSDIGVVAGSGLGGTSLISANVAAEPDFEIFDDARWPAALRDARSRGQLRACFDLARRTLSAGPHPGAMRLNKVQALREGADGTPGTEFGLHDLAVNFTEDGSNRWGVNQPKCINCGDCVTGCNVGAKNSLDTNYLAMAAANGVDIFPGVEVDFIEQDAAGGYLSHYLRYPGAGGNGSGETEEGTIRARRMVMVGAGSLGSTALLLRSREEGLGLPEAVGARFSGNGDFFGISYNNRARTDVLGWGGDPNSDRARRLQTCPGQPLNPGPATVSYVRYNQHKPVWRRFHLEDWSLAHSYVDLIRGALAPCNGHNGDRAAALRRLADLGAKDPELQNGALNHSLICLTYGHDGAGGRIALNPETGEALVHWPHAGENGIHEEQNAALLELSTRLGGSFLENPLWKALPSRPLMTFNPLGGCAMGDDAAQAAVNHNGQVYDDQGGLHEGLYVVDGAVMPSALGVNPMLTISALAELRARHLIRRLQGEDDA